MIHPYHPEEGTIQVRVVRRNAQQVGNNFFTTKVTVVVVIWTKIRNLQLENQRLENGKHLVKFELDFSLPEDALLNKIPTPTTFQFDLGEKGNTDLLNFNDANRDLFSISFKNIPSPTRPTGGNRTVITYQDTILIDDTLTPKE